MGLLHQIQSGILHVTLDNASRGNSFGLEDAEALRELLLRHGPKKKQKSNSKKLSLEPTVRGLLLTANGRLFCAGGNLDDYAKMAKPEQGKAVNRKIAAALKALSEWPLPTVCAVTGDCYGGGVEVISAFDKILSVPEAMFGLWQRRIGLSFGWGGGARLEARVGLSQIKTLPLEGRSFSAFEAHELGLVDAIHLKSTIEASALAWLRQATGLPQAPVGALKTYASERETKIFETLWWNDEHRAVLSKRKSRK